MYHNASSGGSHALGWPASVSADAPPPLLEPVPAPLSPSSPLAFKGLLAFTFVMLLAPQSTFPQLAALRPALLAAFVAFGAYIGQRLVGRERIIVGSRELWISLALLWWTVLMLPMSLWMGGSVALLADLFIKALLVFWLIMHVVDTPLRLVRLTWWLTLMAVPIAVGGVNAYLTGKFIEDVAVQRIQGFDAALTLNPNDLALMLNLLLPLSIALLLHARSLAIRALLAVIVALEAAGIVFTFSRSGFVTLAAIFLLYLVRFVRRRELLRAGALVLAVLMAAPLVPGAYVERLVTIVDKDADPTGSAQTRWSDMALALQAVSQHPVAGAGLGSNILALNKLRGETWTAVHDVYLQYAVDLGLPGLLLFLMLLGTSIHSAAVARKEYERREREELGAIADAIRISLIAFAVAALFYPAGYHFYFYYFAGLAVAARHISRHGLLPPPALRPADTGGGTR